MTVLADAEAVLKALEVLPEETWDTWDDKCDCPFPRIGFWTNPYSAETLEVRMCCIWQELYKLFPDKVRLIPAFRDYNAEEWVTEPQTWNGEYDMPRYLWYRQLARQTGRSVAEVRAAYRDQEPPKGVPRPRVEPDTAVNSLDMLFAMVNHLAERIVQLEGKWTPS